MTIRRAAAAHHAVTRPHHILPALALAFLAVAPAGAATPAADVVIVNGRVYPADGSGRFEEAVAIRQGRILAVGKRAEIEKLKGAQTRTIDARGGAVTPGLIDTHVHFLVGAESLEQVPLTGVRDAAELRRRVSAFAAAHPDRPWILGNGYFSDALTARDLDAATGDRPAVLRSGDAHWVLANSKALAAAGITAATRDPEGGRIVRDAQGQPTGLLLETAQGLALRAVPPTDEAERLRLLALGTREALKAGVTTILNIGGSNDLQLFDTARAQGKLGLRIYHALWLTGGLTSSELPQSFAFTRADADRFKALRDGHRDDAMLRTGIVKIMLDGVIESHTASMLAPYEDEATTGHANYTPEELNRVITMMDGDGWQIMTHGLGDRAVRMALDAYAAAASANPAPAQGRRHKIEHVETIDPQDVPRFGALGVTASLQPDHAGGMNDKTRQARRWKYLGYTRSAWGFPWKSVKASGGHVAFGSDWPVAPLNIGPGMAIATGRMPNPPIPEQRLTVPEVIDGYTREAAYSIFADKEVGTLTPGKRADIVIFRDDIFRAAADRPRDTLPVAYTLLEGAVAYQAGAQ